MKDEAIPPCPLVLVPLSPCPLPLPMPNSPHPTPLHPTPYTLHPTPYTPHPTPHTLHPSIMTVAISSSNYQIELLPGSAISIPNLTWQDYQRLLLELGDDRGTRIAYSNDTLEIRMPSQTHEIINRLLAKIIFTLALELGMEINEFGSTTLSREDLNKGIEPDSCF